MESKGAVLATLITPGPMQPTSDGLGPRLQGQFFIDTYPIPTSMFEDEKCWEVSPISKRLGFPLKVTVEPVEPSDKHNNCVAHLFLSTDPASWNFGATTADPNRVNGAFLVVRCDGEDLHHKQFGVLFKYINEMVGVAGSQKFRDQSMSVQKPVRAKICKSLKPRPFAEYYEAHRQKEILERSHVEHWIGLTCPVRMGEDACVVCGVEKAKVCARCKKVRYCSKDCQKEDWKDHKGECKSLAET